MKGLYVAILALVVFTFSLSFAYAIVPSGVSPTEIQNSSASVAGAGNLSALAGNVTEMSVSAYVSTQAWTGYYGNVSGVIQLGNAAGNVMYNWSLASPEGEIYASTSNSVSWGAVSCFNYTQNGTWLETNYTINESDADGVNETFALGNNHDEFFTNSVQFAANTCMSTTVYGDSGAGVDNEFEEVLLYDNSSVIYVALLEEADTLGFNDENHDFEMLVLEDGHGSNTASTIYYFYVEIE